MYLVYTPSMLSYRFGNKHPMKPERYLLTYELIKAYELADKEVIIVEPRIFEEEVLLLAHDEDYIDFIKDMSKLGEGYLDYGDTPAFKGCFEAAFLHVSATLTAVEKSLGGNEVSVNLAGGYHHARRSSAGGFCIFNDVVIATNHLIEKHKIKRIAVVDFDVHHGDGTQELLYDKDVLKIDLHEDGRYLYPGTGFVDEIGDKDGYGYMVNIPMPPYASDDEYILAFKEIVVPLLEWYKPEFLICQCGVDAHYNDPLAHMELTSRGYESMSKSLSYVCKTFCKGKCILLGGGGYNLSSVPRMWLIIMSSFLDLKLNDEIPKSWTILFERITGIEAPESLYDKFKVKRSSRLRLVKDIISRIKSILEEIHGPIF